MACPFDTLQPVIVWTRLLLPKTGRDDGPRKICESDHGRRAGRGSVQDSAATQAESILFLVRSGCWRNSKLAIEFECIY
jgi:hypothetical protein